MLQQIKDHRAKIDPPTQIASAAQCIWKFSGKDQEFLRTNCDYTTYAIKDLLTPGEAETAWTYSEVTKPYPYAFEIVFGEFGGEDHYMFVIGDKLYQSFAFVHEVIETSFDPDLPLWKQVSHESHKLANSPVHLYICSKLLNFKDNNIRDKMIICCVVINTKSNEILLVKNKNRSWEFPGGKSEHSDSNYQTDNTIIDLDKTAFREFKEETGLNLALFKHIRTLYRDNILYFIYTIQNNIIPSINLNDTSITEAKWWNLDDLPSLSYPEDLNIIKTV